MRFRIAMLWAAWPVRMRLPFSPKATSRTPWWAFSMAPCLRTAPAAVWPWAAGWKGSRGPRSRPGSHSAARTRPRPGWPGPATPGRDRHGRAGRSRRWSAAADLDAPVALPDRVRIVVGVPGKSPRPVPGPTCPAGAREDPCGGPARAARSRPPAPGLGGPSSSGGPWRPGSRCSLRAEHAQQFRNGRARVGLVVHGRLG